MKQKFEIDGCHFSSAEEFYEELTRVLGLREWGRNLDALRDVLSGGFGTPEEGFMLTWKNSKISEENLNAFDTIVKIFSEHKNIALILK